MKLPTEVTSHSRAISFVVLLWNFLVNSLLLLRYILWKNSDCFDFSGNIIWVHYFNTTMLITLVEQELAFPLDILVTYIYTRGEIFEII